MRVWFAASFLALMGCGPVGSVDSALARGGAFAAGGGGALATGGALAAGGAPAAGGATSATACSVGLSAEQCADLARIQLPAELPRAAGNSHADDPDAALLGFKVFFDSRFSANLNVRCESCHSVDYGFADNKPTSIAGLGPGVRNAPTVFNAARYTTFLWDGRADSLWSQPLFAFENPAEMGFTRLEIAHLLGALYSEQYASVFGALPDLSDAARFPAKGAPGDAAFDAMSAQDQLIVSTIVANLGKALEAYMRKVATGPSAVDKFLAGDVTSLTDQQRDGMYVFASAGCLKCHGGPQLSDNQFHNLGVSAAADQPVDPGRAGGIATLQASPFNRHGSFFDGAPPDAPEDLTPLPGAFRTPSLRNLLKSAPYGHNGTFGTLESIVDFHLQGGGRVESGYVGTVDPLLEPKVLSDKDRAALVEFLKALVGAYPALPWGQWPNGNG